MISSRITEAFDSAISGRRLLEHPYYQRWQEGLLTIDDLAGYAEQYRHFEQSLPGVLGLVSRGLEDGTARKLVESNLHDETTVPRAHIEIFEDFASAVKAGSAVEASSATRRLVDLYESSASSHNAPAALAVIGAYEMQAAEIALTKAESLRAHYGFDRRGTEFWDVHAEIEQDHAAWTIEALSQLDDPISTVVEFATACAEAWWAFLDEREADIS
jgi:pyrroloquinoline quinone (PQQ) biosynthesis protein C